ncbi:MED6 mediator sub complex component-domain-containing protein [Boletus edulis BED1]|uniref:Mediator of RNA polymerase II transcription subunit 6 n=1 Tax=Boletus edulis BED1 TaxID=1328754 RepID=A0AAD4GI46_BOLED|nr:MED6 mediator sub complex component-domain-containing protein [Boletus edulis BED1]
MDDKDLHPSDDYSHRFFIWHEWIQAHGPLSTENVFDYFATSMFYDKQSNNQVLRMQTVHTGTPILNEAEELKRFTGIEFALAHASPPSLFIVHKRERLSPDQVRPLAAYFIINNRIYQSPDVYTLLSNRLLTSLNALQSSLDLLRRHRPDYTPRSGFVWPIIDSSLPDTQPKKPDIDVPHIDDSAIEATDKHQPHGTKKHQNNSLMVYAMRTTAMHSNIASSRSQPSDHSASTSAHPSASSQPPLTSAPLAQRPATPKAPSTVPSPQDPPPVKGPVGAGKKKKKRMSLVSRMSIPLTHLQALQSW